MHSLMIFLVTFFFFSLLYWKNAAHNIYTKDVLIDSLCHQVNSRLLVVKLGGSKKFHEDFWLCGCWYPDPLIVLVSAVCFHCCLSLYSWAQGLCPLFLFPPSWLSRDELNQNWMLNAWMNSFYFYSSNVLGWIFDLGFVQICLMNS